MSQSSAIKLASIFGGGFIFSAFVSYNRDTLALVYYAVGYLLPIAFLAICAYSLINKNISNQRRMKLNFALIIMFVTIIIFTETRISAMNVMMLVMLLTPIFTKTGNETKSSNLIRWSFTFVIIPITLIAHYRAPPLYLSLIHI